MGNTACSASLLPPSAGSRKAEMRACIEHFRIPDIDEKLRDGRSGSLAKRGVAKSAPIDGQSCSSTSNESELFDLFCKALAPTTQRDCPSMAVAVGQDP